MRTFQQLWRGRQITSAGMMSEVGHPVLHKNAKQTVDCHSIASGLQIAAGAIGGIYASTTFMQRQRPKYEGGLWATAVSTPRCLARSQRNARMGDMDDYRQRSSLS
jgi:hypothetical protein